MSRHVTRIENIEVVVGWDHPLMTYFGQVHNLTLPEDKQIVTWVGTKPRELYEIEDLVRALPEWRPLIEEHAVVLYQDKDEGR